MFLISGGWLLVANFRMNNSFPSKDWTAESSYRGISNFANNEMGITKSAMKELRTHLSFTQLRFHCSKRKGRTFHVITAANSSGEAVVQYFSGKSDNLPPSCNSFERMDDDTSQLALNCNRWGNDDSQLFGKWGHKKYHGEKMMYNHAAFIPHKYHWLIVSGQWLCDDGGGSSFILSPGDFWKIYVR